MAACWTRPAVVDLLVLGYGNELRCDDGVGPRIARRVARWQRPGVLSQALCQLTPELAADLAAVRYALFVDAALGQHELKVSTLQPAIDPGSLGHTSDPAQLLGWTKTLYGRQPVAWLLTVPVSCLDYGKRLSPRAARGMRQALGWIRSCLDLSFRVEIMRAKR
jgi:hydrogenase maturation protease